MREHDDDGVLARRKITHGEFGRAAARDVAGHSGTVAAMRRMVPREYGRDSAGGPVLTYRAIYRAGPYYEAKQARSAPRGSRLRLWNPWPTEDLLPLVLHRPVQRSAVAEKE